MKSYGVDQCALYKMSSPAVLADRLGAPLDEIEELANCGTNYRRFSVGKTKRRRVEEPKHRLRGLHKLISRWLARIEAPAYLHSAIRGRSYVTNALSHRPDVNLIRVDIRSFFQNVSTHAVYLFFVDVNALPRRRGDVARQAAHG